MRKYLPTNEYDYRDLNLQLNGLTLATAEGVSLWKRVDKSLIYGEFDEAKAVVQGVKNYGGNLSIRQSDFERLSFLYDFTDIDGFVVTATFAISTPNALTPEGHFTTYTAYGVAFTDWNLERSNGDGYGVINLPFICRNITVVGTEPVKSIERSFKY